MPAAGYEELTYSVFTRRVMDGAFPPLLEASGRDMASKHCVSFDADLALLQMRHWSKTLHMLQVARSMCLITQ